MSEQWTIWVCPKHGLRHGAHPNSMPLNNSCVPCGGYHADPIKVVPESELSQSLAREQRLRASLSNVISKCAVPLEALNAAEQDRPLLSPSMREAISNACDELREAALSLAPDGEQR